MKDAVSEKKGFVKAMWCCLLYTSYASEKETEIANLVKDVKRTPKLYVKFAQADAKSVAQTLVPVSYTHLDVYKRQASVYGQRKHAPSESALHRACI